MISRTVLATRAAAMAFGIVWRGMRDYGRVRRPAVSMMVEIGSRRIG